jgi:hypothetical protein
LLAVLLAVPVFAQVASRDCPQAFLDTTGEYHELKDIQGEELKGTSRNAGERKMFGTYALSNPCLVPFVLRLTFEHGGAFRLERYGKASNIGLRDLELRYRDRNEVSLTKKFSRTLSKSSGYVYELEFLKEDMQPNYKMELWGYVNEREAKRAVGGVYKETIQLEAEAQFFRPEKADTAAPDPAGGLEKRRKRR